MPANLALHVAKVHKHIGFNQAQIEAHKHIDKKKKYHKELKNFYSFRNLPKNYFIPKTMKTKKINGINLVYGELKPEKAHLHGSGLGDFLTGIKDKIVHIFSPAKEYNNISRTTLNKYKDCIITKLTIYRTPLPSMINKFLNTTSGGKFEEEKKKLGYDKFYHLALIIQVSFSGINKNLIVEKNEVIHICETYATKADTETMDLPYTQTELNIGEFMTKAEQSVSKATFFEYDPFHNNCQNFIKLLLEANKLYSPNANTFIFQDIRNFNVGDKTKGIAKGVTDFAGIVSRIRGKGKGKITHKIKA